MRYGNYFGQALGPNPLGSPSGSSLVMYPVEIFQTPLLDFTQPISNIELAPARRGYAPVVALGRFLIEQVAGTQTTPPTTQAGNDPTHTNVIPQGNSSPSNTQVNTAVPPAFGTVSLPATTVKLLTNSPVLFDIVAGAQGTGGFVFKGKFVASIFWIAIGDA